MLLVGCQEGHMVSKKGVHYLSAEVLTWLNWRKKVKGVTGYPGSQGRWILTNLCVCVCVQCILLCTYCAHLSGWRCDICVTFMCEFNCVGFSLRVHRHLLLWMSRGKVRLQSVQFVVYCRVEGGSPVPNKTNDKWSKYFDIRLHRRCRWTVNHICQMAPMCLPVRHIGATLRIWLNLWFLQPTWVHKPNGKSIGSAIFTAHGRKSRYTLQWACLSSKIAPFHGVIWTASNKWFLGPIWAHNPNGISLDSAFFAQITPEVPIQGDAAPSSELPLPVGDLDPYVIHGSGAHLSP